MLTASLGYSTTQSTIARNIAISSSAICDGPSSPIQTPTCEPTSFRLAIEIAAMRIWSTGALQETGERRRERHLAAAGQAHRHADHVLLGNETFEEPLRIFLEKFLRVGGVLRVAVQRDDARIDCANLHQRGAVASRVAITVAQLVSGPLDGRGLGKFDRFLAGDTFHFRTGCARELGRQLRDGRVVFLTLLQGTTVPAFLVLHDAKSRVP